ncbi:hypothetical protein SS50377_24415 [Spironucleus salmonicida]|uniref:Uncharacterized protein n=1 Tax=Spironucleus salmonicida TaxID=348837 RepID=V6LN36_9EUKA|nr:hypothetical protein SS50377_24415 [Spironucleus salmonicida]|eukprot:EST46035.1 Hypothetical protein SS50377_14023 [Spironucleus salmonicida]
MSEKIENAQQLYLVMEEVSKHIKQDDFQKWMFQQVTELLVKQENKITQLEQQLKFTPQYTLCELQNRVQDAVNSISRFSDRIEQLEEISSYTIKKTQIHDFKLNTK